MEAMTSPNRGWNPPPHGAQVPSGESEMEERLRRLLEADHLYRLEAEEVLRIASAIEDGNAVSWSKVWRTVGHRFYAGAARNACRGRAEAAARNFLKASTCFRTAALPGTSGLREDLELSRSCFRHGARALGLPLEQLTVRAGHKQMPGYFLGGRGALGPSPTLIIAASGMSSEELCFRSGLAAHRRGYNSLVLGLPGPERAIPEDILGAAVALLSSRTDVDPAQLAVLDLLWDVPTGEQRVAPRWM